MIRRRDARGQALVEFALVLPIFLVIVFGMIDFGWIIHKQLRLDDVVREAVNLGRNGHNYQEMVNYIENHSQGKPEYIIAVYITPDGKESVITGFDSETHILKGHMVSVTAGWKQIPFITPLEGVVRLLGKEVQKVGLSSKSVGMIL